MRPYPHPCFGAAALDSGSSGFAPLQQEHLHSLALLYLAVAFGTDRALLPAEQHTIVGLIHRWCPQKDREAVEATVEAALAAARTQFHASVEELAHALRPAFDADLRREVLADLGRVAKADGTLSVEEAALIGRVRTAWAEGGGPEG